MNKRNCPWSPDELKSIYHEANSQIVVAELAGVSKPTVIRWLKEAGVVHRNKIETRQCAQCERDITRYATRFVTPKERTFCSKSCALKYWRSWYARG